MDNKKLLNRLNLYLPYEEGTQYENTEEENTLVDKFSMLYNQAKSAKELCEEANSDNIIKWRKAYKGTLNALTKDGKESKEKGRRLQKLAYEIVESTIDNSIPMPTIKARYKKDLPLIENTENYLKFEVDRILTKYLNDKSERATYVDGTSWYKIWWDSEDNTHERSGDVRIAVRSTDEIVPQPGVSDYKQLEYIFEIQRVSVSRLFDLYNRRIEPDGADCNLVTVVSCYYLNDNHIVGLFMWAEKSLQVICNEYDWQIRKIRKCTRCGTTVPSGSVCPVCGGKHFKYENATEEVLQEDLYEVYNPYEVGESDDKVDDTLESKIFLTKGTKVPYYQLTQLPFVPRPAVSSLDSIYGISEVSIVLEMQDMANKVLSKSADKVLKSGAVVTKPAKLKIADTDETFKVLGVRSAEEAQMVAAKQIVADTSQDILLLNVVYDNAKSCSGITNSFQGQKDTTATSGKAKQVQAVQTAGRIESLRVMKSAAFAGVYELVLKYLLAFSDEKRTFTKVLPEGEQVEEAWSKYMFLEKDEYGTLYYRDDFHFDCDPASTLSQNRVQMWKETEAKFIQGAYGAPNEIRTLKLFWNIMDSLQYPLAKLALAGIKEQEMHLPEEMERAILANPDIMNLVVNMLSQGQGAGGARPNSGPQGNGATHAANVEKTNITNRARNEKPVESAQSNTAHL